LDLKNERREYKRSTLSREKLCIDPFDQFKVWIDDVADSSMTDPTAMVLATSDSKGRNSQRTVLMKEFSSTGLVFYTNLKSKKAQDIEVNKQVSVLFPWYELDRQVQIRGFTEMLDKSEVEKYFKSRPKMSQISAWVSKQSSIIKSKSLLEDRFQEIQNHFLNREIDLPDFWGGIRIIPDEFEFWQGGERRLHDRFVYKKNKDGWLISRLSP
jgi:pyridoxamine 5'-phosphate oxidase|tara:strand:- start:80 stop:715 length:636 start_codon:yes stop_codon:yes gene_type:complete